MCVCAQELIPEQQVFKNYDAAKATCDPFTVGRDGNELGTLTLRDKLAFKALAQLSAAVGWLDTNTEKDLTMDTRGRQRDVPPRSAAETARVNAYQNSKGLRSSWFC